MTTSTENKQVQKFDNFGYVKRTILTQYVKNLIAGKDTKAFDFEMKAYANNQFVFGYLNKIGALKIANVKHEDVSDETGKFTTIYTISIKDFDIDCKATSKEGKEFRVFDLQTLGGALLRANK
jgi:hypothetical protein